jgi:RNA polymerase sigma factor (sigma-70 family)
MRSEKELLEGCLNHERIAQRQLYEQLAGKMYVVCLRYAQTTAEAEDILQEAFIKVFEKIHTFRQECPLSAWVKRIVVNTALNHVRSRPPVQEQVETDAVEDSLEDEHSSLASLQLQELLELIKQLPSGCQTIFNLYAIEGYQHNEIAQLLGISEGTSKSQYSRAKMLLRQMLEKQQSKPNFA